MKLFGLTGGVASGKTAVACLLTERGIPVIDADSIGHEVIAQGGEAEQAVVDAFGETIVRCGKIDREQLGAVVFARPAALEQLNAIVHPIILSVIREQAEALQRAGNEIVVVEAALLGEAGVNISWLTGLILVLCKKEERLRRLQALRGMSAAAAEQRIAAQLAPEAKIDQADFILYNDAGLKELTAQVDALVPRLYGFSV